MKPAKEELKRWGVWHSLKHSLASLNVPLGVADELFHILHYLLWNPFLEHHRGKWTPASWKAKLPPFCSHGCVHDRLSFLLLQSQFLGWRERSKGCEKWDTLCIWTQMGKRISSIRKQWEAEEAAAKSFIWAQQFLAVGFLDLAQNSNANMFTFLQDVEENISLAAHCCEGHWFPGSASV